MYEGIGCHGEVSDEGRHGRRDAPNRETDECVSGTSRETEQNETKRDHATHGNPVKRVETTTTDYSDT